MVTLEQLIAGGNCYMSKEKKLDKEWIRLIFMAKQMGLSSEEIRIYLKHASQSGEKIPKIDGKLSPEKIEQTSMEETLVDLK